MPRSRPVAEFWNPAGREPGVMGGPEPDEKHADVLGGFEPG